MLLMSLTVKSKPPQGRSAGGDLPALMMTGQIRM